MKNCFNMKFRNGFSVFYMMAGSDYSDQTGTFSMTCARRRSLLTLKYEAQTALFKDPGRTAQ